ncbi:unnamed protein product [Brassicogethes aeneus]|uniref:Uncharacterized protein n=1 Tax=Brassicogethes aeneus TaxID=1431903 RepID=A0A9P0B5G4_BRAAE|nr:unnamed protein product [Brassicogethes aeneus]
MVCKEEVLSWFKDLESYKRIDVLYNLLNMCLPFELRFLGSCVEEIGKHTYQELRGPEITANDYEKLSKDATFNQGLLEENVRHRVLLYLSLLSSRNYSVANFLYKKFLRTEHVDDIVSGRVKDELLHSETLLLFTMALYHPAFTFDQKQFFSQILSHLIESNSTTAPKPSVYGYPPGFGYPSTKKGSPEIVSSVPVKSAPIMCYSDSTIHQQPPGLPHLPPQPPIEFIWNVRPGFLCAGAPEVPPFPPPSASPQLSRTCSPSHSRSASPLRPANHPPPQHQQPPHQQQHQQQPPSQQLQPVNVRLPPPPPPERVQPPPPPVVSAQPSQQECLPPSALMPSPQHRRTPTVAAHPPPVVQMQAEGLTQSSLPMYQNEVKLPDEEHPTLQEEKHMRSEHPWHTQYAVQNGMRFPLPKMRPFLAEHMQAMSLDGENSLHHSNSSSDSSPNRTPPGTPHPPPPAPCLVGQKMRNGLPPPQYAVTTMCDAASPPPPPYSNCSLPYTYQQFNRLGGYAYNSYRPPFAAGPPYPTATYPPPTENFATFAQTIPYVPLIYSSPFHPPPSAPRGTPPGCFNCGARAHQGADCALQSIEELTKSFQLDFNTANLMPDQAAEK